MKLKNKQHEPHQKLGVISGAPEGLADPAPHVAPVLKVVLIIKSSINESIFIYKLPALKNMI